jgi:alanyl-tRNA synthetase
VDSAQIRTRFLDFFAARGHTLVPSASLILDDPTLLFVNAGMVPFKPYFLGQETPPYPRATSVQKVVRTNDIEEVGRTTRHASFFQMAGNFSFGDYFKETAIPLAWQLLTTPVADGGYGFDPDRIWATVYHDDDEAERIWREVVGLPAERIQRRGMADNYWSMGVPGPCGPCSEIYYDRGPEYGREGGPVADEDRYLEVWNLVFMQYERGGGPAKEGFEILGDLPARNIDTGMGLERMAALLQGVDNIYEIDTSRMVLDRATQLSGRAYGSDEKDDVALRVVTDHTRTAVMLISDGVTPGNEGRGYVLRRMMRRVVRSMRLLGATEPTLRDLCDATIEAMSPQYPELRAERARILSVVEDEEHSFAGTLRAGTQLFDQAAEQVKAGGRTRVAGETAFRLHDTFGFPIDLTLEMAAEAGLNVDTDEFERLMAQQRDRAKADARAKKQGHADTSVYREVADALGAAVSFTGYDSVADEATVRGLVRAGAPVPAVVEGDEVEVVLDRTPFYAEAGGQLADRGRIELASGAVLQVDDVQAPIGGLVVHRARVLSGEVELGQSARAAVDVERRMAISRAHTATHMLHKAFREALGDTAAQAGSENAPGRLRFDFSASGPVTPGVLTDVQDRVNSLVEADLGVRAEVMDIAQARQTGAMALFGEKYGDEVRVISVGDWARELCGGTHAQRSGQLGLVTVLGEQSIGQGVRRVEALVGLDAFRFLAREHALVSQLTEALKVRSEELPDRVATLVERLRGAERELERLRAGAVLAAAAGVAAGAVDAGPALVATHRVPDGTDSDDLRRLAQDVLAKMPGQRPCVVVVAGVAKGRPSTVVAVNPAAREVGLRARDLVRSVSGALGGGGGGKDDIAQGGGTDASAVDPTLADVPNLVRRSVATA